jgi:hypothetical protein
MLAGRAAVAASALLLATLLLPPAAAAQHIIIKTVPIPTGEQFNIFPAHNMGMGSVRVALEDTLLDPFSNPALAAHVTRLQIHALPTVYGEANRWVGGRTLPVALLVPGRRIFGGGAFAMQQISDRATSPWWFAGGPASDFHDNSSSNLYVHGMLGARVNGGRSAVGISAYHADLGAVDGLALLYGNSIAIEQSGSLLELRAGATHDFGDDRRLDAVVLSSRLDMTHNVFYAEWTFDPITGSGGRIDWTELNEDRTRTWGAQLRYTQPLETGTRIGFVAAANTKAHPKIPNYNLVNIPRDPGNSTMFNAGVGLSNAMGPARFGVDLVYEPGRSHTWAYADTVIATPTGTLDAGDKTIDNQFRFNNWALAMGLEREGDRYGFQLGLRLRQIRYTLDQQNFLTELRRNTRESWLEWSPSWSGVVKFPELELRYTGRFTAKGWPEPGWFGGGVIVSPDGGPGGVDFVVGATGPVWLPEYRVTTHRLTVSVPLSR